jgi:Flp pilus assembly protein TadB
MDMRHHPLHTSRETLMPIGRDLPELSKTGKVGARVQNLAIKALAAAAAGVVLVSAIAVSIVVFAVAITVFALFGGYLWWKTRHLRKQMRAYSTHGDVIEGVVVRETHVKQVTED